MQRPSLAVSFAAPLRVRSATYLVGFVAGAILALAFDLHPLVSAVIGTAFAFQFAGEIWWRRTHDPAEDGPYAFYTKARKLQKARQA